MGLPSRLLFVDDEETSLVALRSYFEGLGYPVDCAQTVTASVALLSKFSYGVAVIDLRVTGASAGEGLVVIDTFRELSPPTRVVLLTAYGSDALTRSAKERGAAALLSKPQPLAFLAKLVAELLEDKP